MTPPIEHREREESGSRPSRVRAWLELLRVSNYPTIVSNALTGCALGVQADAAFPWRAFAFAAPSLLLIYAAGMASNDALDAGVDRIERPRRPIPSGRVARGAAIAFAVSAALIALAMLALTSIPALVSGAALVACVALYNFTHRLHAGTVLLMSACRALSIVTAACAAGWPPASKLLIPVAAILAMYVISLSLVARNEAGKRGRVRIVVAMVCAISLLDAAFLTLLERWIEAGLAVVCFVCSVMMQRRILGS